ncbi:cytochrome b/b6 domain-containing protein [Microbacterium esteraromaticum]|uniref:Cytochrome b/b6 domain-containing protein n=1 Tax=Microbacterium esteraromaticum TaxID=57043 RepID=A0A939IQ76_9MICO|nr:cytochrome b/b6 domain-containing protein [Microbacterium esteraromaticum]MBN8204380.1 cytochrome b/b6 domain-containing protein [Microbacterium esteraromaticum]MBN8414534.1 cytochrome b/b6 domain-containing protein [Microbacterium esteraromaticum]
MGTRMLRRGLPRINGGEPWPPVTEVTVEGADNVNDMPVAEAVAAAPAPVESAPAAPAAEPAAASVGVAPASAAPATAAAPSASLRRGLPRVAGGDPWPPASAAPAPAAPAPAMAAPSPVVTEAPAAAVAPAAAAAPQATAAAATAPGAELRRGLPRVAGGDPWPPAGTASVAAVVASSDAVAEAAVTEAPSTQTAVAVASDRPDLSTPLPFTRTVWQGRAPRHASQPVAQPSKLRPTWPQAIGGLLGLASLGLLATAGVFLVRAFLTLPFMQDFLAAYPGEYHPAFETEPGFAPWVNWAHFFNIFLMVLIIRSGLGVRTEKRPTVFWAPRGNSKGKISLTLWFHQSLDILWIVNGVIFVVLLIVTGHWVRIVPTSWEVFPNALSALLQYISLDWPTENGWVNYNSLQQLAYFTTVFIAAPLAVITGFRMSGLWPKKAEKLSKAYPVEWARALHFPVMLYFVAFIIVHVALVFLTGALRNLNHMFAAQGSVDGIAYADVWTGFWVFVGAMVVVAAGWFAARPLVLAPIAKLFGQVSGR